MKVNGEAIYQTHSSPFRSLDWGRCTRKEIPGGVRLYLHVFNWPETRTLNLDGILNEPLKAYILGDASQTPLGIIRSEDGLMIGVPFEMPDTNNTVIALDLKGKLDLTEPPQIIADFDVFVDSLKVKLVSDRENVQIRYTTDQSVPGLNSELYTKPIILRKPVMVSSRCFRDGKPVSAVGNRIFRKVEANPDVQVAKPVPGINYRYYEGNWDSLPDFRKLNPAKEGFLENISLDPKTSKEYFGFSFQGYILVPSTDMYAFSLNSDDGSNLWIDEKKVVDNDGLHGSTEVESAIGLRKGYHAIRVDYFNKTGSDGITVSIRSTILKKQVVPSKLLFH
jgi:hypothetical protein